jgi:hypothetical protein
MQEVFWGRVTVYLAERRLLANALLDAANERFVHLSESCIPIAPFPVAYKYFTESEHSFVEAFKDPGRGGLGRYNRIRHREKLNPEVSPSQWRKGGQWFEMSRALALMVVDDNKYLPKFQSLLCKNDCVCYSEEHYLPTVLTILAAPKLANRTTTFVDFHLHNPHPKKWEPEEITAAFLKNITTGGNCTYNGKMTETCHMFARKFSSGTIKPLLKLAATSLGIP